MKSTVRFNLTASSIHNSISIVMLKNIVNGPTVKDLI